MLEELISKVKENVPDVFIDKNTINTLIPWINENTRIIDARKFWEVPVFPPIFVEPHSNIPEIDEELEGDIRKQGTEALAWYIPFHQSQKWGIYFRVRGLSYLSNFFKNKKNLNDVNERIKMAFEVLFYHEFFHFLTEMTATNMEMIYHKPIYNAYVEFIHNEVGFKSRLSIEEPLANAYTLMRLPKQWHTRIKRFFKTQPFPYSTFDNFTSGPDYLHGKRRLGVIIHFHNIPKLGVQELISPPYKYRDEPFWEFLFNVEPERLFLPDIPIYFVIENKHPASILKFITPIFMGVQIAVYPSDHPPPHLHIWIPADSKKEGRYLYPSLEPYMGAEPLTNKKRKIVQECIERYKNKIESIIKKQAQH